MQLVFSYTKFDVVRRLASLRLFSLQRTTYKTHHIPISPSSPFHSTVAIHNQFIHEPFVDKNLDHPRKQWHLYRLFATISSAYGYRGPTISLLIQLRLARHKLIISSKYNTSFACSFHHQVQSRKGHSSKSRSDISSTYPRTSVATATSIRSQLPTTLQSWQFHGPNMLLVSISQPSLQPTWALPSTLTGRPSRKQFKPWQWRWQTVVLLTDS